MTWSERFEERGSALCVGLDPEPSRLPGGMGALEFCLDVVELTQEWAACFKPNLAFFERLGSRGMADFEALVRALRERGLPVIADAKRGDIASTAQAYADAYFGGPFDCDALTVNASVGFDAIEPFVRRARELGRGLFPLLRTSNPGAALFQEAAEPTLVAAIRDEPVFGAVVGATDSATGARLRAALPDTLFLVPGFGAQGGADLAPFFAPGGTRAVVNSSRGILYAGEGTPTWKDAVREAARSAHATVESARKQT
ncbi:MAG: orotidine-5'-phosphate decarboxylase [Planctomycetota bacterium]